MGALGGTFSVFVLILGVVLAIMALLMPLYVYQIRNRTLDINKKMDTIIELLGGPEQTVAGNRIKACPFCNAKNREIDLVCVNCGKAMGI